MRDKSINDRMGCDWLWIPRYTATLPRIMYERAGWSLPQVAMWQYCGDGMAALPNYPRNVPDFGAVDISVVLFKTLADFQNNVCSQVIEIGILIGSPEAHGDFGHDSRRGAAKATPVSSPTRSG